jgi:radical SAM superfamily enzyme YgiQ (UPF0313 family)
MRIALISPKGPLYRHRGGIFGRSLRYAPLTLTTLAALVPDELGAEVRIVDEGIEDVDPRLEADIVGMTVITGTARRAYQLAAGFRSRGIPVVLGGPHVTLVPEDAAPHADAVVVGYAEESWPRLLRDFAAGRMHPRYDQRPGLSLAGLPVPRRELLPRGRFLTTAVFEATRACVHDCEFCVVPSAWGRKPYQRPVGEVIDEIREHGSRRVLFLDLNLVADPDYAARLFAALIPLRLQWFGLATTLLAERRELLALAARSGCRGLLMGLESVNPESLRQAEKGFNSPGGYRDLVRLLHDHRIALQACFVFGLDGDTPEVFEKTSRFAVEAGIDLPRFAIATPFPGTPFFRRLESEGRILTRNWELYDGQHVVFRPARMSVEQLQRGTERAWRHAYSISSITRRLARTASPFLVGLVANIGYRFYARRLNRFYTCDWGLASSPLGEGQPA